MLDSTPLDAVLCCDTKVKAMVYPVYAHTHRVLRGRRYNDYSNLLTACEEMWTGHIRSPFLLSLLVDIYEEDGSEPKILEAIKVTTVVENCFFLGVYISPYFRE